MIDMQSFPTRILEWIKHNKLATAAIALVLYLLLGNNVPQYGATRSISYDSGMGGVNSMADVAPAPMMAKRMALPVAGGGGEVQNSYNQADRMVSTDTNLSMKVKDVKSTINQVSGLAFQNGGFMVNSQMSSPEGGSSGSVNIKVQAEKLTETLEQIRGIGVKVVSEYVSGTDVTDQYTDIEERLRIVIATKAKMEEMLRSANKISDMLEVQREIMNLQAELDGLKGQQRYLEKTTQLASVSVYLSTDELALPYAPDNSWRPQQIYKEAVRSMIQTARSFANLAIWIVVYSPIWIPAAVIYWFWQRRQKQV